MCERARHVLAVEIDYDLVDILERELDYDNLTIIEGDILKKDINEIADKYNDGRNIKVVANLPYYITTPIESITVMIQKEVAERMMAKPGDKDCGAISLAVRYYATPYLAANVPPNCFKPRPKVASAVIRLTMLDKPYVEAEDERLMFRLIRAAFGERRKTLLNAIANSPELDFSKDMIRGAIESAGLLPEVRGEKLDLENFAKLSNIFSEHENKSL